MAVRLDDRNPMTTADHLTTIEGVPGYFSEFSKVAWKTERPTWGDGLTNIKRKAASGTTNFEDVTLGRAFDPEKDGDLVEWCAKARCALEPADLTVRPVKRCNGIEQRGSKAWRFSGCRLASFETFDGMNTAEGNAVVMIKIVFTVEQSEWA